MKVWTVEGYERTTIMMRVEAETEEEAVEKAIAGDYDDADSEPGPKLLRPKWTAQEGWAYGRGNTARRLGTVRNTHRSAERQTLQERKP